MSTTTSQETAYAIRDQICAFHSFALPCLGPKMFYSSTGGLVLANSHIVVGESVRKAMITIDLNGADLYDITVKRVKRGSLEPVTVYEAKDVFAEDMVKFVAAAGSAISADHSPAYQMMVKGWK